MDSKKYDIIVVGAGHAGVEACTASARMGLKTLVVTNNLDRVAYMSCNPSIGGLAKGHIVKEIDALGGVMARAADKTCIQFKRLNASRGPAVRGTRMQTDKKLYCEFMSSLISNYENLEIYGGEVTSLIFEREQCTGVVTTDGVQIFSRAVIITTGTFLKGVMHIGNQRIEGGRVGDKASVGLSDQLSDYGFKVTRLKTGTPPRLHRDSIQWEGLESEEGDLDFRPFSFRSESIRELPNVRCHLTYTNDKTHEIIRKNLSQSPMFTGAIEGMGPRYCPSIEDKITRFAEKSRHQSFLEPEGLNSESIYLQGISTSLPEDIQIEFLKTIKGLENVQLIRPGYAVEYDFFDPRQILPTLETRTIEGLYFAGQVNGTSGYEEAAGQGLLAGINAGLKILEKEPLILLRSDSYIGVLIDDLVTRGTKEPYRMMTSRAEYRLHLREDNALDRLCQIGYDVGSLDEAGYQLAQSILQRRESLMRTLETTKVVPNNETQKKLLSLGTKPLQKPQTFKELLRRPEINCESLAIFGLESEDYRLVQEPLEIAVNYEGYISREQEYIEKFRKMEDLKIPADTQYEKISGLSAEGIEKLNQIKPLTLGQASRVSGVNPTAIQALLVYLNRFSREQVAAEKRNRPRPE